MNRKGFFIGAATLVAAVGIGAVPAWAYLDDTSSSTNATVSASTLGAPVGVSASDVSNSVISVSVTTGPTSPSATGYKVYPHGNFTASVCTIGGATGSCNATGLSGSTSYKFDILSTLSNWTSATTSPATTGSVLTMPDAPASVSLVNGGGSGNAYINSSNVSGVNVDVSLPTTSSSSDTVHLTASDTAAHTVTATTKAGIAGGGTEHFTGLNLTTLNDGTVTFKAWASNASGNATGGTTSATSTDTKDVVAPAKPSSVTLANGGGTGNAYINSTNYTSLNYTVAEPSSANDSTTDTVTVTLSDGTHQVSGTASGLGSAGGNVTVSGINASTLTDGTITETATVTDLAGNVSSSVSTSNTKDTVGPTITLTFPTGNVSGLTNWNAGCGTPSTGDICGTASDTGTGVSTTVISINKGSGIGTGMTCEQVGHPDHFNQQCANFLAPDSGTVTSWTKLLTYTTGTFTVTVRSTDVAGNITTTTFTSFTIS